MDPFVAMNPEPFLSFVHDYYSIGFGMCWVYRHIRIYLSFNNDILNF